MRERDKSAKFKFRDYLTCAAIFSTTFKSVDHVNMKLKGLVSACGDFKLDNDVVDTLINNYPLAAVVLVFDVKFKSGDYVAVGGKFKSCYYVTMMLTSYFRHHLWRQLQILGASWVRERKRRRREI